jgi:hypothetical protein
VFVLRVQGGVSKNAEPPYNLDGKILQVLEGLGGSRSMYDEAKYANYPSDELRMDFYLRMMRTFTRRGDCIFNVFGGSKQIFVGVVSVIP